MSGRSLLRIEGLRKQHRPDRPMLFDGLDLELAAGEYVAIVGESGVGKSTLLNLIAGLEAPDAGRILIDGIDITALPDDDATRLRARRIGFVFQAFHLLPYLDIGTNVALPLQLLGVPRSAQGPQVGQMLAAVGLEGYAPRYPRELSGGEMQRAAIARALIHQPAIVLADEPTGNLDARSATQVLGLLRERVREGGGAGILITHSAMAAASADRVYELGPGGLRPCG